MTSFKTIVLESDNRGVATLTLSRPQKHNALNAEMIRELTQAAALVSSDAATRVVILAAAGKSFCAGGDLDWMKLQFEGTRHARIEEAGHLARMLQALDELPKLVIGVVNGAAYGGGVGLAAVCDIVIAGPQAHFALTETRLGLIPATIAPYLHGRIGPAELRRFALHAAPFESAEAKVIGLVSEIAATENLADAVERHIRLALACAPGAIGDAKRLFRQIANGGAGVAAMIEALADRWESTEARAGIAAFFNKQEAPWQS
jgi:methylglutaconyl-CoA hydratase